MRLIDADKLLRDIEKYHVSDGKFQHWVQIQQTIEPERKTGRWIHDGYAFKGGIDWMHCSECGHKDSWSAATRTPFCAWCGARTANIRTREKMKAHHGIFAAIDLGYMSPSQMIIIADMESGRRMHEDH